MERNRTNLTNAKATIYENIYDVEHLCAHLELSIEEIVEAFPRQVLDNHSKFQTTPMTDEDDEEVEDTLATKHGIY